MDAVLDLYNDLAHSLRGGEGDTLAKLNERLRSVFTEFRIDTVEKGVLGVLPVLHADVVARYGSDELAVIIGGRQVGVERAAATHPAALFATGEETLPSSGGVNVAEHFAAWRSDQLEMEHNSQALRPVSVGRGLELPPFELRV